MMTKVEPARTGVGLRPLSAAVLASALTLGAAIGQANAQEYTRADTLRGSLTSPARTWWDVTFYDLHVEIEPADSSISGHNTIVYRVVEEGGEEMQIDLQAPLRIDSIVQDGERLPVRREGAAWFARVATPQSVGDVNAVTVHYGGKPHVAVRPPWDGGFTWAADSLGTPWIVTTDQGIGASIWWPNKDTYADEPDSQRVALTVPDPLVHVGNGRLEQVVPHGNGTTTWSWFVANPINNYAINVAAGDYTRYTEFYEGELGTLTMDFFPLTYNLDEARRQFPQALTMMECFEHWFGPYPFYEDGYKLIEVPNTGMEHQSAVTYGNHYQNGYRGRDTGGGTGLGLEFDFIIIHESAHEWWANSITMQDQADMWIHESFANYAESLYVECLFDEEAGARYVRGTRQGIQNERPIIPDYGVNAQGPGDMYSKGGNMLHTIRQIVGDTETWRETLRGLQETFRHQIVTTARIEAYITEHTGEELSKVFDQYLRTAMVPVLEYAVDGSEVRYRWTNVVPGFDMPVEVTLSDGAYTTIHPTESWQTVPHRLTNPSSFGVDPDYYVESREVEAPGSDS